MAVTALHQVGSVRSARVRGWSASALAGRSFSTAIDCPMQRRKNPHRPDLRLRATLAGCFPGAIEGWRRGPRPGASAGTPQPSAPLSGNAWLNCIGERSRRLRERSWAKVRRPRWALVCPRIKPASGAAASVCRNGLGAGSCHGPLKLSTAPIFSRMILRAATPTSDNPISRSSLSCRASCKALLTSGAGAAPRIPRATRASLAGRKSPASPAIARQSRSPVHWRAG